MTRALVLELVGPAGAGKTAVAAALRRRDPSIRSVTRVRQLRHLPQLLRAVAGALTPASLDLPRRGLVDVRRSARYLVRLRSLYSLASREAAHGGRAVILDEGPVFAAAMLRGAAPVGRLAAACTAALRAWAGTLDAIVWLDAPDPILTARIAARHKAHELKGRDTDAASVVLTQHRRWLRESVALLAAHAPVWTVEFRTDGEPADRIADRIFEAITSPVRTPLALGVCG